MMRTGLGVMPRPRQGCTYCFRLSKQRDGCPIYFFRIRFKNRVDYLFCDNPPDFSGSCVWTACEKHYIVTVPLCLRFWLNRQRPGGTGMDTGGQQTGSHTTPAAVAFLYSAGVRAEGNHVHGTGRFTGAAACAQRGVYQNQTILCPVQTT